MYKINAVLSFFLLFMLSGAVLAQQQSQSGSIDYEAFLEGEAILGSSADDLSQETWREFEKTIRKFYYTADWQELAQSVLEDDVDYWYMYFLLGRAAIGLGRLESGLNYYRATVKKGEQQKCIDADRSVCSRWIKSVREAIPEYEDALSLDKNEQQKFILLKNVNHVRSTMCTLWASGSETNEYTQALSRAYKGVSLPARLRYASPNDLKSDCMLANGMHKSGSDWEFTDAEKKNILVPKSTLMMTRIVQDRQCEIIVELTNEHYEIINPLLELTFFDNNKNSLGEKQISFPAIFNDRKHTEKVTELDYCDEIDSAYVTEATDRKSGQFIKGVNDQLFNVQKSG